MAEARNRQLWRMGATFTVAIANSFRTAKSALRLTDFPYCRELSPIVREATPAECKAFAAAWNQ